MFGGRTVGNVRMPPSALVDPSVAPQGVRSSGHCMRTTDSEESGGGRGA